MSTRDRVYALISEQPRTYRKKLMEELRLSWGTIYYHVGRLIDEGAIREELRNGRLELVASPTQRGWWNCKDASRIVSLLSDQGALGPTNMARTLGMGRKRLQTRLLYLEKEGAIVSDGQYHPRFRVKASAKMVTPMGMGVERSFSSPLRSATA